MPENSKNMTLTEVTKDWLSPRLRRIAVPSWIASVAFHGLIAALFITFTTIPQRDGDYAGDGGDSFRSVGIYLGEGPGTGDAASTSENNEVMADHQSAPTEQEILPSQPNFEFNNPLPLSLPPVAPTSTLIGPSGDLPEIQETIDQLTRSSLPKSNVRDGNSSGPAGGGGSPTGGNGGTSLFGVQDVGKRFVYVIDRSASMEHRNALRAAKTELLSSISRLNETQEFQVIFYNNSFQILTTPGGGRTRFFRGTDAQRLAVSNQLLSIDPTGSTQHLPAVLAGLEYQPDVIFILTDGATESLLSQQELNAVRQANRQGTRIHCIEFGYHENSPLRDEENFLKKLSQQNNGRYIYRDITKENWN